MLSETLKAYAFEKYKERAPYYLPIREQLEKGLAACTMDERTLMHFFYGTMPVRDAGEYPFKLFLCYVKHALWLREHVKWCRELPEDIFVHHVLYYRINTEDISHNRAFFYEELKDRIAGLSLEDAVLEINYWCAEHATYETTDYRTASPMTLYHCFKGRCGEESTFAVTAYRSMGIPARQVYTPRWVHCDDNHAWVEVFIDGKWYFLGACEPEAALNQGWFAGPASRALLVHHRTFSDFECETVEERIENGSMQVCYNITDNYARTCKVKIAVKDKNGQPADGVKVFIEALNMAEYSPAATLTTDKNGEARITIGLGDIHIRTANGDWFAEKIVSPESETQIELILEHHKADQDWVTDKWHQASFKAPKESLSHSGDEDMEKKKVHQKRVREAGELLQGRINAAFDATLAAEYPEEEEMLRIAGENFPQLYRFLTKDDNPARKKMLHTLSSKDYKDLRQEVLESHLIENSRELPEEIYLKYLLCPRVLYEELTPYRQYINSYFTTEEKEAFCKNPEEIWNYIRDNIDYDPEVDYQTICATPIGCLKLKHGNKTAQKILFAAICRSLGIPARVNEIDRRPEYYLDGAFVIPKSYAETGAVQNDDGSEDTATEPNASLTLLAEDGSIWNYFRTWTIGHLEDTAFNTLDYEGISFDHNALKLSLKPGVYRIISTLRLPDGGQQMAFRIFSLKALEHKEVEMLSLEHETEDSLVDYPLEDITLTDDNRDERKLSQLLKGKPGLLGFLGVGAEPTEHVLNELLEIKDKWNDAGLQAVIVLADTDELSNNTLQNVLQNVNGLQIMFDRHEYIKAIASVMQVDEKRLPLLAAIDENLHGVYACSGYNVGSVELIMKILQKKDDM